MLSCRSSSFTRPACSVVEGTCPTTGTNPLIPGEPNGFSDKHSWSNWTPKLGLSWQATEGVLAYASWTRGYRSGGYNLRITQPAAFLANAAAAGTAAFGPERVDSYEAGLKLQTADGRGTAFSKIGFQFGMNGCAAAMSLSS